ncbi:unnamed protein product [Mytilus edulis]|uniref:Uncharacterized protein n=1 Tax=Mytilus edulis TaxID=6550 RepID=A0A8S3RQD7_MYTED|nr:unnamed protein product [Mytilus edulis]
MFGKEIQSSPESASARSHYRREFDSTTNNSTADDFSLFRVLNQPTNKDFVKRTIEDMICMEVAKKVSTVPVAVYRLLMSVISCGKERLSLYLRNANEYEVLSKCKYQSIKDTETSKSKEGKLTSEINVILDSLHPISEEDVDLPENIIDEIELGEWTAEVKRALKKTQNGKSAGIDSVITGLIKADINLTTEKIAEIFNSLWEKENGHQIGENV